MKKIISLALALIMILSLATTAFAADTGSITVTNTKEGKKYSIYKLFDAQVGVDTEGNSTGITYTVPAGKTLEADNTWFEVENGVVVTKDNIDGDDLQTEEFRTWAKSFGTQVGEGKTADASGEVVFEDVPYGYYYIDSTLGANISVTSTNPNASIKEKNEAPSITKEVQEDSTSAWENTNDAEIGETVNFKIVINAYAGAEGYELYDDLPDALTLDVDSIAIGGLAKNTDYTVDIADGDFTITFKQSYLNTITGDDATQIVITYSAVLNKNAEAGVVNENAATLKYGDASAYTVEATTKTYTWGVNVLKYANDVVTNVLEGVEFVLLNNDNKVATVVDGKLTGWVAVPNEGESWPENTKLITNGEGKIRVEGLDDGKYYLRETKALPGYNELPEDREFTINDAVAEVEINNQSGSLLPDTGGMGTTLFYILGGLMTVGALVLLVTKKRMYNV